MPKAQLPTTVKGWGATVVASVVGFMAGFLTLKALEKL